MRNPFFSDYRVMIFWMQLGASFFLHLKGTTESRRGRNGRKNQGRITRDRKGEGWRYAAEVEVDPKRMPWFSKESRTLPKRRGRSPPGLDPFFNCIQENRRRETVPGKCVLHGTQRLVELTITNVQQKLRKMHRKTHATLQRLQKTKCKVYMHARYICQGRIYCNDRLFCSRKNHLY